MLTVLSTCEEPRLCAQQEDCQVRRSTHVAWDGWRLCEAWMAHTRFEILYISQGQRYVYA
jgi:hypothetical protein